MIIKLSHYLDFFVALNQPWQLVKTLKTKLWLQRLSKLRVGAWWIDMYHLAMIIFSDIIFRFAVYCFNRYFEQCKGFFERKIKDSNLKKSIDFRVITEHWMNANLSEAFLELSRINPQTYLILVFSMEEIHSRILFQHFEWNKSSGVPYFCIFN